jgi:hypothetical protein
MLDAFGEFGGFENLFKIAKYAYDEEDKDGKVIKRKVPLSILVTISKFFYHFNSLLSAGTK